jgi:hypothetical protein
MPSALRHLSCACCLWAVAASAQSPITLTITASSQGYAIPADFSGLSFETRTLLPDRRGGHLFSPTNTPLVALFRNIGLTSLRIGGATVDMPSVPFPATTDIDQLFAFARAANVKVIYSLRLLETNATLHYAPLDASIARYIRTHYQPQLACFAIGNEPDWKSFHKQDRQITNLTTYLARWQEVAAAVTSAVPGAQFAGPDTGCNFTDPSHPGPAWTTSFAYATKDSGLIESVTQHHYVGGNASSVANAGEAINAMLSPGWDTVTNQVLYNLMAAPVLADGLRYRLTEANDFTGGVTNASNAFASALWTLDFMHWWAAHGAAGINFHNKRWIPTDTIAPDSNGHLVGRPKAYAIKAFELGSHGQVQPLTMTNLAAVNLTAYTVGGTNALYVTVINKDHGPGARDADVTIRPSGWSSGSVSAMFLTAPNGDVTGTSGITLGGASITNNSPWLGQWTPLNPLTNGQCTLTVAASAAAVVKIEPRPVQ